MAWLSPVLLVALSCGGTTSPQPAAPPPAAPRCVTDFHADALGHAAGEVAAGEPTDDTLDDADGDSQPEHVVGYDCGASGDCARAIYFSAHGCASYAGTIRALSLSLRPGYHRGVRDLRSFESNGCAGLAGTITNWQYDGHTFVDTTSITCACPDTTTPRPPECPASPMTGPPS